MPSTLQPSPQDLLTQKKRRILATDRKAATGTTIYQWNKRPTDVLSVRADSVDTITPATAVCPVGCGQKVAKGTRTCCSA